MKKIYIIVSKTPTFLAKIIRWLFKTEYSHVSISFDDTCENMISFGRRVYWNPFIGGLVDEGKSIGFFKHFKNSEISIFEMKVEDDQYTKLESMISGFKENRYTYSFNVIGMTLSGLSIPYGKQGKYFCSEFIAHLLKESNIHDFDKNIKLVRPHEFAKLPNSNLIYKGKIKDYEKK